MKRIISALLAGMLLWPALPTSAATAMDFVDVNLNGVVLAFDKRPFVQEGRTMMPLRTLANALGAEASWDSEHEIITLHHDGDVIYLKIGVKAYTLNGNATAIDTAPILHEGQTMVPLRIVAETLGCEVSWQEEENTVLLTKEGLVVDEALADPGFSEEDLLWLARIVNVEGLDIGYEAKLAIANVVLNRVASDDFPDSVYDVIKDKGYTVQFPPAHRSTFDSLKPDAQSLQVAEDALRGSNNIEDCLYFNNRPFKWKADDLYKVIEGEYFYK